jgi:Ca2+-transporting ATPase
MNTARMRSVTPRPPGDAIRLQVVDPGSQPAADVAGQLGVDLERGLADPEARARLETVGANELEPAHRVSVAASLIESITEPFVLLLALAGGVAVAIGEVRDGLLVLVGLIPIVGADVITVYRAERALETLREAAAPRASVRRAGAVIDIPAHDLVPGDVVQLRTGDVVPGDLRVVRSHALAIDRSILTGESLPEPATAEPDPPGVPLPERHAVAYAGTAVVGGRGEGVVVATGARTEMGAIARQLAGARRSRTPLERELDRLVRILLAVALGLIAITVGSNLLAGASIGQALLAGIAAAIAAIPEEPPILVAVVLGLGAYRLLRRRVLVRRLNAQETLGAVDLIISDKTGTLTENRLALEAVRRPDGEVTDGAARDALVVEALRAEDDAWIEEPGVQRGSFTRGLLAALDEPPALRRTDLLVATPPSDGRPYAVTRSRWDGRVEDLALGAPEAVLDLVDETGGTLDDWEALVDAAAGAGRRLLLLVGRPVEGDGDGGAWSARALFAFRDPLRAHVPEAARSAAGAGIQTVVVTGDHPATATAIAAAAGLRSERVLLGTALDQLTDAELARTLGDLDIVARATPDQKLRLVRAAAASGRTTAVTGDGVNDAPALQAADVAVAMGSGTAVAREAADLVLGDDSFATLMEALAQGRRIVANVQKGLIFLVSTHVGLLGFILLATLAGTGTPLLPLQILWIELFIDVTTSVAFEREPAEPDLMRRPPRPRTQPLLTNSLLAKIAVAGSITAVGALLLMTFRGEGEEHARWLAFNTLVFGQLVRAYANRSLERPVLSLPVNRVLLAACLVAAGSTIAIPYLPLLAEAFRATPLDAVDAALIALIALGPAVVAEVMRATRHRPWLA